MLPADDVVVAVLWPPLSVVTMSSVVGSVERSTGAPPAVIPQMGGSICNDLFTDLLGIPAI